MINYRSFEAIIIGLRVKHQYREFVMVNPVQNKINYALDQRIDIGGIHMFSLIIYILLLVN
jgi:hypothetical protein